MLNEFKKELDMEVGMDSTSNKVKALEGDVTIVI
jgi:hypothetical protein